jgi:hypothetical protein
VPCVPACAVWVGLVDESTAENATLLIWILVCNESEATNTTAVVITSRSVNLVPVRALAVVAGVKLNAVGILMLSAYEEKDQGSCQTYPSAAQDPELIVCSWVAVAVQDIDTITQRITCVAEAYWWRNRTTAVVFAANWCSVVNAEDMGEIQDTAIVPVNTDHKLGEVHSRIL